MKKRESQNVKAYRRQMKKADHDYYPSVHTSDSKVDGKAMGPFETKYESMKKSLLIFTEMGAINDGLASFIEHIAEHASARIYKLQVGGMCKEHGAKGTEFATFN